MPQLIPAVKVAYAAISAWMAKTVTVMGIKIAYATIVKAALVAGAYAYSRAQAKKALRGFSSLNGRNVTVRDPAAARQIIYGQVRVGGTIVFAAASGSNNEYLNLVVALAGHEVEEIGDVYFNDELALTGAGSACSGRFAGYGDIFKKLGGSGQTVETNLQAQVGAGVWTNNHRLRGIAYIYVRLKHSADIYSTGVPNITAIVKGRKLYDPRSTLTVYSANSALCVRDFLTDTTYGLGMTAANEIDDTETIAAANICDEDVALAAGGTEDRYKTNGVALSSETAAEIIDRLVGAMSGSLFYVGGKWIMRAGAHVTPTITLTEDDLRGSIEIQTKDSRRDTCNRVRGTYISANNQWQPADFPPIVNATYKTEDGEEDLWRDIVLPFTTSDTAAQRIAKIELEKARQDISVIFPAKLTALNCQCGDVVQLTIARYGWSAKQFEVVEASVVISPEGEVGVDLTLRETASGVWTWSTEETAVDLAPNTTLPDPYTVPAPGGLTLTSGVGVATQQTDGTILNRLKVAWTAPARSFVTNGGKVWIEYKKNADADWIDWAGVRGDQTADYITDVKVGVSYDVRVRFENVWGVRGAYSTVTGHSVAAAGLTPTNPTAATKTDEGVTTTADGNVFSFLTFSVPALPANAAKQFLMYKRSTDTDWLVAAGPLTNTSAATVTIPDLTPGVIYAIATLALSSLDVASSYVPATSSPFTAPTKTAAPGVPTSLSLSTTGIPFHTSPAYTPTPNFGSKMNWTTPADDDLDYVELKVTFSDSDAATDYVWNQGEDWPAYIPAAPSTAMNRVGYSGTLAAGHARIRSVNKSGIASAWVSMGNLNGTATRSGGDAGNKNVGSSAGTVAAGNDSRFTDSRKCNNTFDDAATARTNLGLGSMATQAASSVAITGGSARLASLTVADAGASGPRAILCIWPSTDVKNLTGGATTETIDIDLTNFGFAAKPDAAFISCSNDGNVIGSYDFDTGSTATNARFNLRCVNGGNLPSGNHRFSIVCFAY